MLKVRRLSTSALTPVACVCAAQAASKIAACNDKSSAVNAICDCGRVCTPWGPCFCGNPLYAVCNEAKAAAKAVLGAFCSAADLATNALNQAQSAFNSVQSQFNSAVNAAKSAALDFVEQTKLDDHAKKAVSDARNLVDTALAQGDSLLDKFLDRVKDLAAAVKDDLGPIQDIVERFADLGGDDVKKLGDRLKVLSAQLKDAIGA